MDHFLLGIHMQMKFELVDQQNDGLASGTVTSEKGQQGEKDAEPITAPFRTFERQFAHRLDEQADTLARHLEGDSDRFERPQGLCVVGGLKMKLLHIW